MIKYIFLLLPLLGISQKTDTLLMARGFTFCEQREAGIAKLIVYEKAGKTTIKTEYPIKSYEVVKEFETWIMGDRQMFYLEDCLAFICLSGYEALDCNTFYYEEMTKNRRSK